MDDLLLHFHYVALYCHDNVESGEKDKVLNEN